MIKRKIFSLLLILVIVGVLIVIYVGFLDTEDNSVNVYEDRGTEVSLNFEHEIAFEPEIVQIILGVETEDRDLDRAFNENNEAMNQIFEEMEKQDLLSLETQTFRVNPRTRRENDEIINYYVVLNQIEIKTENLEEISQLVQKAVEAGANKVVSLNYLLADESKAKKQVIEEAYKGLTEKVEFIAETMGKENIELDSLNVDEMRHIIPSGFGVETMQRDVSLPQINPQNINVRVNLRTKYTLY